MKFSMSDDEIRVSYNTAKDQKAQVKVLAELNVTTPAVMAAKLRDLGCNVPDFPSVDQRPLRAHDILFDETRARQSSTFVCAETDQRGRPGPCAAGSGGSVPWYRPHRQRNRCAVPVPQRASDDGRGHNDINVGFGGWINAEQDRTHGPSDP